MQLQKPRGQIEQTKTNFYVLTQIHIMQILLQRSILQKYHASYI